MPKKARKKSMIIHLLQILKHFKRSTKERLIAIWNSWMKLKQQKSEISLWNQPILDILKIEDHLIDIIKKLTIQIIQKKEKER